ncbi:hypothetical protein [Agrobacterium tumefaciens]|uniref:hypothetical protein n=1 Tax=Agrobacterium tumefaciens TaxID=358 RepID=UPI001F3DF6AF|nr:hypothetical protein [Agrobacterium tumefaciens]WCK69395.1 hypothetical protein G6L23_027370 [Agrobacterium tumefaciens]
MKLESRHPDSLQACRCLQHIQLGRIIEDAPDQHNIFRTVYAEAIMWSEMPIGKYKGKTLPQLLLTDPDYFFWAMEQDDFFRGGLAKQAADILRKARRIKIPKPDPANWRVEYFLTPDGKFAHFDIVEADRAPHVGSSRTSRSPTLDFAYVRQTRDYDKLGYKHFIKSFKYFYFGSSDVRLNKAKCEAFFDNPANFS